MHTALAIAIAFLLNLNRVAVLLGVYSNLPWIIGPYYAFATMAGAFITGHRVPAGFGSQLSSLFEISALRPEFWRQLVVIVKPFGWPYAVGSMVGSVVIAAAAYPLALAFVTSRRRIHDMIQHKP